MAKMKRTVKLNDAYSEGRSEVTIEIAPEAIIITPKGYCDCNSENGDGSPIIFEFREGIPHVMIWSDINEECATHTISLENAKEDKRSGGE